jgi:hypothetical protein
MTMTRHAGWILCTSLALAANACAMEVQGDGEDLGEGGDLENVEACSTPAIAGKWFELMYRQPLDGRPNIPDNTRRYSFGSWNGKGSSIFYYYMDYDSAVGGPRSFKGQYWFLPNACEREKLVTQLEGAANPVVEPFRYLRGPTDGAGDDVLKVLSEYNGRAWWEVHRRCLASGCPGT